MRTDLTNIVRQDINVVNEDTAIEHEGKKLIFDKLIEQMRS